MFAQKIKILCPRAGTQTCALAVTVCEQTDTQTDTRRWPQDLAAYGAQVKMCRAVCQRKLHFLFTIICRRGVWWITVRLAYIARPCTSRAATAVCCRAGQQWPWEPPGYLPPTLPPPSYRCGRAVPPSRLRRRCSRWAPRGTNGGLLLPLTPSLYACGLLHRVHSLHFAHCYSTSWSKPEKNWKRCIMYSTRQNS